MHAEDLSSALQKLSARAKVLDEVSTSSSAPPSPQLGGGRRKRSSTIVVYCPEDHGHSPALPNIEVEDTTGEGLDEEVEEREVEHEIEGEGETRKARFHTARPPVELMTDA